MKLPPVIQSFKIIIPLLNNEIEGEILTLSDFGEYCPDNSLRGYHLYYLLSYPDNYRPILLDIENTINLGKSDRS